MKDDKEKTDKIQRLLKRCHDYQRANDFKKLRLNDLSKFLNWLIEEKRITKEEIKIFFPKREAD
jgi:uncharacterized protein YehS (DUF1456 family)